MGIQISLFSESVVFFLNWKYLTWFIVLIIIYGGSKDLITGDFSQTQLCALLPVVTAGFGPRGRSPQAFPYVPLQKLCSLVQTVPFPLNTFTRMLTWAAFYSHESVNWWAWGPNLFIYLSLHETAFYVALYCETERDWAKTVTKAVCSSEICFWDLMIRFPSFPSSLIFILRKLFFFAILLHILMHNLAN